MAKKFWFIPALLISVHLNAQIERIDPERPDQTESPDLVAKNIFQAEFGFNKENSSGRNYDLLYPTALFKYGLKKIELRVETVVRSSYEHLIPNPIRESGLDPVTIGFKTGLLQEKKFIPKTSLIASIGIPVFASKRFRADHVAPSIKLVMSNTLGNHADLSYNFGAEWDGLVPRLTGFIPSRKVSVLPKTGQAILKSLALYERTVHPCTVLMQVSAIV